MATTGRKQVLPNTPIASDWGNTVWDQSLQCFATAADRDAQWPNPHPGAQCWLEDSGSVLVYGPQGWAPAAVRSLKPTPAVIEGAYDPALPVRLVGGTEVYTSNVYGDVTVILPEPFGTCILTVIVTNGDVTATGSWHYGVLKEHCHLTQVAWRAWDPAGIIANTRTVRANWMAMGQ